jgi:26S proteasome regulatory subunit N6
MWGAPAVQLDVCREQVEWATAEKRTFLRQRIEARLVALQLQSRNFTAALALIGKLLTEVGA